MRELMKKAIRAELHSEMWRWFCDTFKNEVSGWDIKRNPNLLDELSDEEMLRFYSYVLLYDSSKEEFENLLSFKEKKKKWNEWREQK